MARRVVRDRHGLRRLFVVRIFDGLRRFGELAEQAVRRHAVVHRDRARRHVVAVLARRRAFKQMILRLAVDAPRRFRKRLDAIPARIWQLFPCEAQMAALCFDEFRRERLVTPSPRIRLFDDEDEREAHDGDEREESREFQNIFQR